MTRERFWRCIATFILAMRYPNTPFNKEQDRWFCDFMTRHGCPETPLTDDQWNWYRDGT